MNTAPDLELLAAVRPVIGRAKGIVERRITDARVHAALGSLPTATDRLRELTQSLMRHVSDARASFYRQSFRMHQPLDPNVHDLSMAPTPKGESAVRKATIINRDDVVDLVDMISDAEAALQSATLGGGGEYLDSWARATRDRLDSRVRREVSDSQIVIFEAVGQILIKPELR